MKDKITAGIITYHDAYSYGATLQCLGLQLFLKNNGIEPQIIDYSMNSYMEFRNKHKMKMLLLRFIKVVKNPIWALKLLNNSRRKVVETRKYEEVLAKRNAAFDEFREKWYVLTHRYNTISELKDKAPVFDTYICGSDQIWNPNFCDCDANYFLDFAPENKRIAYAPSFGVDVIKKGKRKVLKERIDKIPYLSIREQSGAEIIEEMCKRKAKVVIDPTFLIDSSEWRGIADESNIDLPDKYILTYFIGIDDYIEAAIEKVTLVFQDFEIINLIFDKSIYGPSDFLMLIKNAEFVLTNSFHGCAFCINFNIPFAIIKTLKDFSIGAAFGRMENLLRILQLEDRIIDGIDNITENLVSMNFSNANTLKKHIVIESASYLLDSIKKAAVDI